MNKALKKKLPSTIEKQIKSYFEIKNKNGIANILFKLQQNFLFLKTYNESLRIIEDKQAAVFNGDLFEYIFESFWYFQLINMRKLVDTGKDCNSFPKVLNILNDFLTDETKERYNQCLTQERLCEIKIYCDKNIAHNLRVLPDLSVSINKIQEGHFFLYQLYLMIYHDVFNTAVIPIPLLPVDKFLKLDKPFFPLEYIEQLKNYLAEQRKVYEDKLNEYAGVIS
jgi:hypothetical protein